jgi:hypothetical protein
MKAEGFVHTSHLVNPIVVDRPEDIVPAIVNAAAKGDREGNEAIIERM